VLQRWVHKCMIPEEAALRQQFNAVECRAS
jgi:hypothetical protein